MDTLQKLRANLESTQEPDPLLADCLREIESLRQQLSAMAAERDAYMRDYGKEQDRKREVAQQLAESQKREVMLRDTLDYAARTYDSVWTKGMPIICDMVDEALAATEPK